MVDTKRKEINKLKQYLGNEDRIERLGAEEDQFPAGIGLLYPQPTHKQPGGVA